MTQFWKVLSPINKGEGGGGGFSTIEGGYIFAPKKGEVGKKVEEGC